MLKKHKLKIMFLALASFLLKSLNYYTSEESPLLDGDTSESHTHVNHTIQEELNEFNTGRMF